LFSTEAESLDNLRNAFSKVLADDRVAGRGHKCDVMEFENPATVNQEMVFICYCHKDIIHTCPMTKYDRNSFVKSVNSAYIYAMKKANFALDVHYVRNSLDFPA